jgi:hypothetical protein
MQSFGVYRVADTPFIKGETRMPTIVVDHHLKDFESWFDVFKSNPPPDFGKWHVARGIDDPNRVHVVGVLDDSEVGALKEHFASENMKRVFAQVNENSTKPIEFIWLEDVTPG